MPGLLQNLIDNAIKYVRDGGSSAVSTQFRSSRAGHLQNAITVDQNILERVEVIYGPASTMYGSDGLGGVLHFRTKLPVLSATDKLKVIGNAFVFV